MDERRFDRLCWLLDDFKSASWPWIPCPECHAKGHLQPNMQSVSIVEAGFSRKRHGKYWDPERYYGYFHCDLACSYCEEVAVAIGDVRLKPAGHSEDIVQYLKLRYVYPAIRLIELPQYERFSFEFQRAIQAVSELFMADPDAAANRMRVAVDQLLTDFGVARYKINTNRKRVKIATHERVDRLSALNPDAAEVLRAVKWIGNEGSHQTGLTSKDILRGMQLLNYALTLLYDYEPRGLKKFAAGVNARKGLRKSSQ